MGESIGTIILRVRGQDYEANIGEIGARAADPRSPWHKEDELHVWLEFVAGHPGSILSFGLTLPVKQYKPDELLALIKEEGEKALEESMNKADEDRVYMNTRKARQEYVDGIASQISDSLSGGEK